MLDLVGFWSYARLDDEHSDGQLSKLRAIVGKAIVLQHGGKAILWQDVAALPYGADWARTIEETIGKTTFFIPVITPRFLKSVNCLAEFRSYRRRMVALGRDDLIFPIHYVDVGLDDLRPADTAFGDDLAILLRSNWIDFRPLFYADPKSQEVRRWAGGLAGDILRALRRPAAERAPSGEAAREGAPETIEEALAAAPTFAPPPTADPSAPAVAPAASPAPERAPSDEATRGSAAETIEETPPAAVSVAPPPAADPQSAGPTPGRPARTGLWIGIAFALVFVIALGVIGALTHGSSGPIAPPMPKDAFRDCVDCPAMVVVPAGSFMMGSPANEQDRYADEGPQHDVRIAKPFAAGAFAVTFDEWDACLAGGGCGGYTPSDQGWGRGRRPVINVSWNDAQLYAKWLSSKTGKPYRLLSESEWEYAARAGTTTAFWQGATISPNQANYDGTRSYDGGPTGVYRGKTIPVGSFAPNAFGLYDMGGNVSQWVEDCYHDSYAGAPSDGAAWTTGDCSRRVVRGDSWGDGPKFLRSACRSWIPTGGRVESLGFRVGRTLTP